MNDVPSTAAAESAATAPADPDDLTAIARKVRGRMARMRRAPRVYDYCYFTARTNLEALRSVIDGLGDDLRSVLDVGCGKKPFRPLFPKSVDYVGMDIGGDTDADVVTDLEQRWPLDDASFDVVIMSEVMEHLGSPEHALAEAARVLRPGGMLFATTPFAFPLHARPHDFFRYTEYFYRRVPERHPFTVERLDASNSVLVTPALQSELLLLSVPGVPYVVKQAAWAVGNAGAALVESLVARRARGEGKLASFLRSNPVGYAVVLRRTADQPALT